MYDFCVHYVPAVCNGGESYSGSGFDAGRQWMWWQLVHDYGLDWLGVHFWDNWQRMQQGAGPNGIDDRTGSNGWVDYIRLVPH